MGPMEEFLGAALCGRLTVPVPKGPRVFDDLSHYLRSYYPWPWARGGNNNRYWFLDAHQPQLDRILARLSLMEMGARVWGGGNVAQDC